MNTGMCRLALFTALLVGLIARCGDDDQPTATATFDVRLAATPPVITKACAKAATRAAFPVLCPARWPPPGATRAPRDAPRPHVLKCSEQAKECLPAHRLRITCGGSVVCCSSTAA
jgi:hypothetical protein